MRDIYFAADGESATDEEHTFDLYTHFVRDIDNLELSEQSIERYDPNMENAEDDDFLLYNYFAIQPMDERQMYIQYDPQAKELKLCPGSLNAYCIFQVP